MDAHAHEIIPRLWLGNRHAALDSDWLAQQNIQVVFNATKNIPFHPNIVHQYRIPVDDNLEEVEINNMTRWSPEIVYKVLHEYNTGKTILVHCAAGMQRSAAIVAMTLIAMTRKPKDEVIANIRMKRRIAFFPAINFEKSIDRFDGLVRKLIADAEASRASNRQL